MLLLRRIAAFFLDYMLIASAFVWIFTEQGVMHQLYAPVGVVIGYGVVTLLSYLLFDRTVGEKILKLQVGALDQPKPTISSYIFRVIGTLLAIAFPLINIIALFGRKKTVADRISETEVNLIQK